MKFLLIIQICSSIYNGCLTPLNDPYSYNSWKDCGLAGYEQTMNIMKELDSSLVNKDKIYIRFSCEEVESSDI